jgi:hypothetical protein
MPFNLLPFPLGQNHIGDEWIKKKKTLETKNAPQQQERK